MDQNQGRRVDTPEEMLALAEELASRYPARATGTRLRLHLRPWMRYALWFLGGAGTAGLCWWASLMT